MLVNYQAAHKGTTPRVANSRRDRLRRSGAILAFGEVATGGLANDAVTNAKLANVATGTFKGRTTAGTGDPEDLSVTQAVALLVGTTANTLAAGNDGRLSDTRTPTDNTVSTAKLVNDAVTNAKLANMAASTIKGRVTSGTGDPEDLTAAQARTVMGANANGSSIFTSATSVGEALGTAADAAAARTAMSAPAIPNTEGSAGSFMTIYASPGNGYSLPAGGTWAHFYAGFNSSGQLAIAGAAGVAAGGTTLIGGTGGVSLTGWAWRIA